MAFTELFVLFGLLLFLIVLNEPIAFAMASSTLIFLLVLPMDIAVLQPILVIQQMSQGVASFPLLAIIFFIYAGQLMMVSGLTDRLVDFSKLLVGRFKAGLAHVNVVASMLFAGISGSAVADTAAIGSLMMPAMEEEGYDVGLTGAITCSSSVIGPIIPPSIIMIIYATAVTNVTVAGLFAAGVIPGALLGLGLMGVIILIGYINDWKKYPKSESREKYDMGESLQIVRDSLLALMMPLIILGGIILGIFTATEAGAVAVLYALVIGGVVYRTVSLSDLIQATYRAATITGVTLFIVGAAKPLTYVLAIRRVPDLVASTLLGFSTDALVILVLLAAILSFMALFIESAANILLWGPVLAPTAVEAGVHPLHFALTMILTLAIGMITPPLGVTLFVAAPIGNTTLENIARNVLPFLAFEAVILLVIILIPEIALFVPRALGLA